MSELELFIENVPGFNGLTAQTKIDYLAYYLIFIKKQDYFTVNQINNCFDQLDINRSNGAAVYVTNNSGSGKKFIKTKIGYRLERIISEAIKNSLTNTPQKINASRELINLQNKLSTNEENVFLNEAINCYGVKANRAAIIMIWNLTIWHLENYIFNKKLTDFNTALQNNPDKKIKKINNIGDFSELQESKFIELMRSAKIITNDERKILDEKLGIRNSAAHPSSIVISEHKSTEFITDLVENIILKIK